MNETTIYTAYDLKQFLAQFSDDDLKVMFPNMAGLAGDKEVRLKLTDGPKINGGITARDLEIAAN